MQTQTFNLYSNAIAHICAGRDIPFSAIALDWGSSEHADRITTAGHAIMHGYNETHGAQTARFTERAQHHEADGTIVYIEVSVNDTRLGTVAAWLDRDGDSVKYEAIRQHYTDEAYPTFTAALAAVTAECDPDQDGPFEIETLPYRRDDRITQGFKIDGADWTAYIRRGDDGLWIASDK